MAYMGFSALKGKLKGKVKNPGAVAASIGKKKYGVKRFQKAAASGTKMKGMRPMSAGKQASALMME